MLFIFWALTFRYSDKSKQSRYLCCIFQFGIVVGNRSLQARFLFAFAKKMFFKLGESLRKRLGIAASVSDEEKEAIAQIKALEARAQSLSKLNLGPSETQIVRRGVGYRCDMCYETEFAPSPESAAKGDKFERFHCHNCSEFVTSYDLCARCLKQHDETHRFSRSPNVQVELLGFDNVNETLMNRFEAFHERILFFLPPDEQEEHDNESDDDSNIDDDQLTAEQRVRKRARDQHVSLVSTRRYVTYGEMYERVLNAMAGLRHSLHATTEVLHDAGGCDKTMVALVARNSLEWIVSDYALLFGGFVSATIDCGMDAASMAAILARVQPATLMCSSGMLAPMMRAIDASQCGDVIGLVVVLDECNMADACAALADDATFACLKVASLANIEHMGALLRTSPSKSRAAASSSTSSGAASTSWMCTPVKREPTDLVSLINSSGSTGLPKSVMMIDSQLRSHAGAASGSFEGPIVSFLSAPLALATARFSTLMVIGNGGSVVIFSHRNMALLFEEMRAAAPSSFSAPPSVFNKVHSNFMVRFDVASKLLRRRHTNDDDEDDDVESKVRTLREQLLDDVVVGFGHRLQTVGTGGAKPSEVLMAWLRETFEARGIVVYESYGSTEVGSIAVNGRKAPNITVKIKSVPELGYSGKEVPFARGELWVRAMLRSGGYFDDANSTASNFDDDGFFNSGDIVEYDAETQRITVLDRTKNFVKLAQSVFVSPEKVEGICLASPLVHQIWVHGSIDHTFLLAVVVPTELLSTRRIRGIGVDNGDDGAKAASSSSTSTSSIGGDTYCCEILLQEMARLGELAGLQSFEVPRGVIVDRSLEFSPENGLLTGSSKPRRLALRKHYQVQLDALFEELGANDGVRRYEEMLRLMLGLDDTVVGQSLADQGLDSVRLVQLQRSVADSVDLGKLLPNELLFRPDTSVQSLARYLAGGHDDDDNDEHVDWHAQIANDAQLFVRDDDDDNDDDGQQDAATLLLTGATGFLGVFLLRQVCVSEAYEQHRIACLVRAPDGNAAAERLRHTAAHYRLTSSIDWQRIDALAGDLAAPKLGVADECYASLLANVDVVIHCGAAVNGLKPYSALRGANVEGTRSALQLAATSRRRATFLHISTLSTLSSGAAGRDERATPRVALLSASNGYASSKSVAELVVADAVERGLIDRRRAIIVRPGAISACASPAIAPPLSNSSDFLSKFLRAIVHMRSAPALEQRFEMTPVDQCSAAIVQMLTIDDDQQEEGEQRPRVYHIVSGGQQSPAMNDLYAAASSEIAIVAFDQWRQALFDDNSSNPLFPLLAYFRGIGFPNAPGTFSDAETQSKLSIHLNASDADYLKSLINHLDS
jgi:thioester reductase-like protein